MRVRLDRRPSDPAKQLAEAGVAREVAAHDKRVDEEADQALQLGVRSPGDRRPDGEVLLTRVAVQKHLERRQQRHVQSRAFVSAECPHRFESGLRQGCRPLAAALAGDEWPGSVRGQLEIGHARELFRPVTELGVEDRSLKPVALPDGVVGVLDRAVREAETTRLSGMIRRAPRPRESGRRSTSRRRWRGASSPGRCALARPVAANGHGPAVRVPGRTAARLPRGCDPRRAFAARPREGR